MTNQKKRNYETYCPQRLIIPMEQTDGHPDDLSLDLPDPRERVWVERVGERRHRVRSRHCLHTAGIWRLVADTGEGAGLSLELTYKSSFKLADTRAKKHFLYPGPCTS